LPLGYQLKASGQERIGNALAESIRRFWRKVQGTKDGKKRKRLKAETWVKLAIKPEEIERTPFDVLAETRNVEEKAASLYEKSADLKKFLFDVSANHVKKTLSFEKISEL